jgi:hypothetical protein
MINSSQQMLINMASTKPVLRRPIPISKMFSIKALCVRAQRIAKFIAMEKIFLSSKKPKSKTIRLN